MVESILRTDTVPGENNGTWRTHFLKTGSFMVVIPRAGPSKTWKTGRGITDHP
jgi:hypothetical protein